MFILLAENRLKIVCMPSAVIIIIIIIIKIIKMIITIISIKRTMTTVMITKMMMIATLPHSNFKKIALAPHFFK